MIAKARYYINLTISLLKWPAAVCMMLALPAAVQTFQRYYAIRNQLNWQNLLYFAIGIGFFVMARVVFIMRRGSAETMEHEITHTLFAMLTLHPVKRIEIYDTGGGRMTFSGKGNWLIAIAPYFFPLAAFTMMFFSLAVIRIAGYTPDWVFIALGCAAAYNLFSFAEQLHPRQTDFKVAGYLFTVCFLPGANCLTFGMIFAFVERGLPGILFFFRLIFYFAAKDFHTVLNIARGWF